MKKLLFTSLTAVLLSMGISSCGKCQVCTKSSSSEERICRKDYDSETEYGFAIDVKEAAGYECKSSI
jgi:hypothetical protein